MIVIGITGSKEMGQAARLARLLDRSDEASHAL